MRRMYCSFRQHWYSPLFVITLLCTSAPAAEKNASDLMPASTVLYAELVDSKQLLDTILDHPLCDRIESLEGYRRAVEDDDFRQFQAVVATVEAQIGRSWREALTAMTAGGVAVGLDAQTEGLAILAHSQDETTHQEVLDALTRLAEADARQNGRGSPIRRREYRGIVAHRVDEVRFATFGPWLLLTNQDELGKQIVDNYLDGNPATLAKDDSFQATRKSVANQPTTVWAYLSVSALRDAGVAKELFVGRTDNPVAELMLGGILSSLQRAPFANAALTVGPRRVALQLAVPHNETWAGKERQYYFGPRGNGNAPELLETDRTVFSLSTFRDLSSMWLHAPDLMDENASAELAQADSNLSTLFSGRNFGEDILGAVEPQIQLIVNRQNFAGRNLQPTIKLPSFAAVFRLKDAAQMKPQLRRTYQSLIGFLNVLGASQGHPQLDLDSERRDDARILSATYVPEVEEESGTQEGRLHFNFSPSVAFVEDRFVVSSTVGLARELAGIVGDGDTVNPARAGVDNTVAHANLGVLEEILKDNERQLIAQNMLSEGHTREEAEEEVSTVLELLGWLDESSLRLSRADGYLQLKFHVSVGDN